MHRLRPVVGSDIAFPSKQYNDKRILHIIIQVISDSRAESGKPNLLHRNPRKTTEVATRSIFDTELLLATAPKALS